MRRAGYGSAFHVDAYVLKAQPFATADEIKNATTGVLGMLHFADFQSPILLEALGDLLRHGRPEEDATQLAARAYLRAAKFSKLQSAAERLRKEAHDTLAMHEDFGMHSREGDYFDKALEKETADAEKWLAPIEASEERWIAARLSDGCSHE